MDYNVINGGLAAKAGCKLFLSDMQNHSGTFIIDESTGRTVETEGMLWFMNIRDNYIYYSDQKNNDALYRLELDNFHEEKLSDISCCNLVNCGEWLYFIDEKDLLLYRCGLNGMNIQRLNNEQTICFVIENESIYYSTRLGIKSCSLDGSQRKQHSDAYAAVMLKLGGRLVFADRNRLNALTQYDLSTGRLFVFDDISAGSINSDGRYLYCSNMKDGRTIYRIDPEKESSIRIFGDYADNLHLIEKEIYFCRGFEWYRMSLLGGQAAKVTINEG